MTKSISYVISFIVNFMIFLYYGLYHWGIVELCVKLYEGQLCLFNQRRFARVGAAPHPERHWEGVLRPVAHPAAGLCGQRHARPRDHGRPVDLSPDR